MRRNVLPSISRLSQASSHFLSDVAISIVDFIQDVSLEFLDSAEKVLCVPPFVGENGLSLTIFFQPSHLIVFILTSARVRRFWFVSTFDSVFS